MYQSTRRHIIENSNCLAGRTVTEVVKCRSFNTEYWVQTTPVHVYLWVEWVFLQVLNFPISIIQLVLHTHSVICHWCCTVLQIYIITWHTLRRQFFHYLLLGHILSGWIAVFCCVDHMMPKELDGYLLQVLAGFHQHLTHHCISSKKLLPDRSMFETFTTYTKWDVLYFDTQSNFFNDAFIFFSTAKFAEIVSDELYSVYKHWSSLQVSNFMLLNIPPHDLKMANTKSQNML